MKVLITKTISKVGLKQLQDAGLTVMQWTEKRELTRKELIYHSKQFDGLISAESNNIDEEFLNECKHLKVISLIAPNCDSDVVAKATQLKIPLVDTSNVQVDSETGLDELQIKLAAAAVENIIAEFEKQRNYNKTSTPVLSPFLSDYMY